MSGPDQHLHEAENVLVSGASPQVPEGKSYLPPSVPSGTPDPNLALFLAAARDPQVDVGKLKELLAMRKEMEAQAAKRAYLDAKAKAKGELPPIIKTHLVAYEHKDGRGSTRYKYEDLFDINQAVDPILAKYGLSYSHRTVQEGSKITVTCIFGHADGHQEEYSLEGVADTSGQKSSNQAITSTVTFLQRGTLKQALGLGAGRDDDGQGAPAESSPTITIDQLVYLETMLRDTASDVAKFKEHLRIAGELKDLTVEQYKRAVAMLEEKKRRLNAEAKAAQ